MQKSARDIARDPLPRSVSSPRRRVRGKPPLRAAPRTEPRPTITRLTSDVDLTPPRGCSASVLLKEVSRNDVHRYYTWWLVVGRSGADALSMPYKHTGEDIIRIDLPDGMSLSATGLQPYLEAFWDAQSLEPDDPPIIKG
jgi:hypothetical protein